MNMRGAALQSGLAALGLIAAWSTWQREPDKLPGEAIILDVGKSQLQKIRYSDDKGKYVELEKRKQADDDEPRVWMKLSADPAKKIPAREVPGNPAAERLWDKFAPLKATRGLGELSAAKLKEVGLDAPKKKLEVTARGATTTLDIGASPFGVSDPYVRDEATKQVYVMGGIMGDLDAASVRLVDRTLHGFAIGDFDDITVTSQGKTRDLKVPASDTPNTIKIVGKGGKPDEMAKNWHDKAWRLVITDVLGKGETPPNGTPEPTCKLTYSMKGRPKGFLELAHQASGAAPPANASPTQAPLFDVWARSEHTAGWVKLTIAADQLISECYKVAAAE